MPQSPNNRVRSLLREINTCRRIWRAWGSNLPNSRPAHNDHHVIRHKFLIDEVQYAFWFRFIVRLYALMEEGQNKFTFGYWLNSLNSTPVVQDVQRRYRAILQSDDFKTMLKNRHNSYAHNALNHRSFSQAYRAVFKISETLEAMYDEIVQDRQVNPIPWTGGVDRRVCHPTNCPGSIEVNIDEFFVELDS